MRILILIPLLALSCKGIDFSEQQCVALASITENLTVRIAETATDEEKAKLVAEYASIAADAAQLGCTFIEAE